MVKDAIALLEFLSARKCSLNELQSLVMKVSPWEELQPNWQGLNDDRYWWRRLQAADYYKHLYELCG